MAGEDEQVDAGEDWSLDGVEQGDLLPLDILLVVGTDEDGADGETPSLKAVKGESDPAYWAIMTQTCDVVRAEEHEPNVHVASIREARNASEWETANGPHSVRTFALPPGTAGLEMPLIDVRIIETVNKDALRRTETKPVSSGLSDAERFRLSTWLGRRLGRHPFPDPLEVQVLRPMRYAISKQLEGNSPASALLRCHERILVHYGGGSAHTEIVFVIDGAAAAEEPLLVGEDEEAAREERLKAARKLLKGPLDAAKKSTIPWQVDVDVRTMEEVNAHDLWYRYHEVDSGI